jgi:predicted metal-binding membrane protein
MNRDRAILLAGAATITALTWLYLVRMATGAHSHATMDVGALFIMWVVMMVAMMLPSTLPFVFVFQAEHVRRRARRPPLTPTLFFIGGYFAIWIVFSAACAALQQLLRSRALLSPMMSLASPLFAGAILLAAGVYQWTPMKNACLRHCRSPLTFLLSDWKEGVAGAFRMGVDHGLFCIGCCWMLMLLPFAAGVMNLLWMAGITVLLLLEKAAPGGEGTAWVCGAVLVLAGAYVIYFGVAL